LGGHIDVVPPGEGWSSDPFVPTIREGYLYGRGAQDMKSGLAGLLYGFKNCNWRGKNLILIITSDEEGEGRYGTLEALKFLEREGLIPEYGLVGEPTSEQRLGDAIKIGRRGSINGVIEIYGKQGHAAYPEQCINPVELIAPRCDQFVGRLLDQGDAHFPPSKLVVTDIRGGMEVTNVTPDKVRIMFNIRNNTQTDRSKVERFLEEVLEGIDHSVTLTQSAYPFLTDPSSKVVKRLEESIEEVAGLSPKLSTAGGTSDARFFAQFGIEVVECGVVNDRIHQVDERVPVADLPKLAEIYLKFIESFE
jgi:succinyl-diaminopimelate desuccinylase